MNWPRYFDGKNWRPVPGVKRWAKLNVVRPCSLCGWARDMAIHAGPQSAEPVGKIGFHAYREVATPPAPTQTPL